MRKTAASGLAMILLMLVTVTGLWAGETVAQGTFAKKRKPIKGSFVIQQEGERLVLILSDDFDTKSGPDLKLVLSKLPLAQINDKNALQGGNVIIALLQDNKGGQRYELPAGTQLADFQSVLIHCEKYEVLWGGGDL